jgi:hypothetical protein
MNRSATVRIGRPSRSRGQALIFFVLTISVVLLAVIFLYRAGRMTTEKMQVQNAADAVAMSVSTLEARDLNFAAYMNRAMIANEVAIGQFVGLLSWSDHVQTVPETLDFLILTMLPALGLSSPVLAGVWRGIKPVFRNVAKAIKKAMRTVGRIGVHGLSTANKVAYGNASKIVHWLTGAQTALIVLGNQVVEQNAPGARPSLYGYAAAIVHIGTYFKYAPSYDPTDEAHEDAFKSLAGTIHLSRDWFSTDRAWGLTTDPFEMLGDAEKAYLGSTVIEDLRKYCILPYAPTLPPPFVQVVSNFTLNKRGGTELRYKPTKSTQKAMGQRFGWSALDNTTVDLQIFLKICIPLTGIGHTVPLPDVNVGWFSAGIGQTYHPPKGEIGTYYRPQDMLPGAVDGFEFSGTDAASYGGHRDPSTRSSFPGLPRPNVALGNANPLHVSGSSHRVRDGATDFKFGPAQLESLYGGLGGPISRPAMRFAKGPDRYGGMWPRALTDKYKGLPRFTNTDPDYLNPSNKLGAAAFEATKSQLGFLAPNFVFGVVKNMHPAANDVFSTDATAGTSLDLRAPRPAGTGARRPDGAAPSLIPIGQMPEGSVAAIARSEVYFDRPQESFFARADGQFEHGSAFNPYWQARLSETQWFDRTLSLAAQQEVVFLQDTSQLIHSTPNAIQQLLSLVGIGGTP